MDPCGIKEIHFNQADKNYAKNFSRKFQKRKDQHFHISPF